MEERGELFRDIRGSRQYGNGCTKYPKYIVSSKCVIDRVVAFTSSKIIRRGKGQYYFISLRGGGVSEEVRG